MNSVELLQTLVRIPSVNPDGDPDSPHSGELEMATYLRDLLQSWGFAIHLEEVLPNRPNLIARAPGPDTRPRLLLGPHLDTVGVTGMSIDPFAAEIRDDKVWGRGTSDTKGPMAAMLMGLYQNRERLHQLPVAIDFVGFMGEESHQPGSIHFARHHAEEYDFALVGEPTSLQLVHTTKGSLWATLESHGQAAHASQPQLGENAIIKLTEALHQLDGEFRALLASFTHPILEATTLNIGTISGGTRPNIVPDFARAQIDIRFTPSLHEAGGARALLQEFLASNELPLSISSCKEAPPMEVPADHFWMKKIQDTHPGSKAVGAPWFSDAAHLNVAGLDAICIGPGSIDQAHTADEFISINALEDGVDWFTKFIAEL
ncbi:MAG: M20 family metallopeptidase [Verrucomicrobiota bacterium JB023]|nr:M20 family metallopeptidase [Verrucomicrobiota bacterium JB023]